MAVDSSSADAPGRKPTPPIGWAGVLREAWTFARALAAYRPRTAAMTVVLLLASSATDAMGLFMLIPLLHAVGAGAADGQQGMVARVLADMADTVGPERLLPAVLGGFVALAVVRSVTVWRRDVLLARTRLGFVTQLRETLHEAVAQANWRFLAGQRQSDLQQVLTGEVHRIGQASFHLLRMTAAGILAATQTAGAFLISPLVSTVALSTGVVLLALIRPLLRRSQTLGDQITVVNRAIFAHVQDFLAGLKPAKAYTAERVHANRFGEAVSAMRQRQMASVKAVAVARATLNVGAAAALAATAWFAIAGTGLTLPELAVVAALFARVMSALMNLQDSAQEFANALPAYGYTQEALRALRRATEDAAGADPSTGKREERPGPCRDEPRMALHAALTVRAVSFDYGPRAQTGAGRRALSGVDLDVQAGKIMAISGPSGAGKSTLADVLLGLLEPTSGAVLVDGVPLDRSNRRRWRRSCAYVPQDPYLFHDTVRANVAWARPHATDRDVWRALRRAVAADFVAELPQGLDTVVGDRGGRLSGGERQRIVLARALLLNPTLLVLDEATSQLDTRTEQRVVEALRSLRGRTTVVAMAHREALMAAADRIVLLDSGRVAATRAPRPALAGAGDNGHRTTLDVDPAPPTPAGTRPDAATSNRAVSAPPSPAGARPRTGTGKGPTASSAAGRPD